MIDIRIIASGSKGNCYVIEDEEHRLLIDPGIPIKQIQKALDFRAYNVELALISHEHQDHCKALEDLIKLGVPAAMSLGTYESLEAYKFNFYTLTSEKEFSFNDWKILPFATNHDATEPLGFLIQTPSGSKVLYATDTYYIAYRFTGVTHYMIECNYSKEILEQNQDIPRSVKTRILTSHFEFNDVKEFFRNQDLSKTEKIYLLHLSDTNSNQKLFIEEIQAITGKPVY